MPSCMLSPERLWMVGGLRHNFIFRMRKGCPSSAQDRAHKTWRRRCLHCRTAQVLMPYICCDIRHFHLHVVYVHTQHA